MMEKTDIIETAVAMITKDLIDRKRIIQVGFDGFNKACIPVTASAQQVYDMRMAFFAGAQHLFGSIISMLDEGTEATAEDVRRMDALRSELDEFINEYEAVHLQTKGNA